MLGFNYFNHLFCSIKKLVLVLEEIKLKVIKEEKKWEKNFKKKTNLNIKPYCLRH